MAKREENTQECRARLHNRVLLAHRSHLVYVENYSGQQIRGLKSCTLHHQGDMGCNQSRHNVPILPAFPWASSLGRERPGAIQGFGLSNWVDDPVTKSFSPAISVSLCLFPSDWEATKALYSISCCTGREESTSICHSWYQISFWRLRCLISSKRKSVPTGILCSPLHLSGWSQTRIHSVPFTMLTKFKMTQLDTKRKGFPKTSYLISSTVHHTVNIFLFNYKKRSFPLCGKAPE